MTNSSRQQLLSHVTAVPRRNLLGAGDGQPNSGIPFSTPEGQCVKRGNSVIAWKVKAGATIVAAFPYPRARDAGVKAASQTVGALGLVKSALNSGAESYEGRGFPDTDSTHYDK